MPKTLPEPISTSDINIALSVLIQTCLSSNYLSIGHKEVSFTSDDTRPENGCDKLFGLTILEARRICGSQSVKLTQLVSKHARICPTIPTLYYCNVGAKHV